MIEAIRQLVTRGQKRVSLMFVGEGPLRDDLTKVIAAAGLTDKVLLLGLKGIDEIAELLHAADLFVMSSAYEGMPMAVTEALASGVPVATTRVGEVALVVNDGVCGRIAEPRTAENLCDAIDWCLDNLAAISGSPCVESASNYSPQSVLTPVYDNYRRLAAMNT